MTDVIATSVRRYEVAPAGAEAIAPVPAAISAARGLPLLMEDGAPVAPASSSSRSFQLGVKRAADIVLTGLGLMTLSALLLIVAAAIKLTSPGPVLFRQPRVGLGGRSFMLLKFRSMRVERCDASGLAQTVAGDDRTTPVGRFIRATSIDELPQLWNVLRGDMSLVGPRPMVEDQRAAGRDYRDVVPYYDYRTRMKPGLTGWAQCNGLRGPTLELGTAVERIACDCAYIQNFSILLDLRIILRTLRREFLTGTGL